MSLSRVAKDPFEQFALWYKATEKKLGAEAAQTMTLSTLDVSGFPDGRMVLLKSYGPEGFVFYTNFNSPKGKALKATPRAALTFHWPAMKRQIRIQGTVSTVSDPEADDYFHSRPRLSQLGAWASQQSQPLDSRLTLVTRVAKLKLKYRGQEIPRPPYWSGFRVTPKQIEFWQAGLFRLHDRFLYTKQKSGWAITRLNP